MQKRSASKNHRLNSSTTIGRNRLSTKLAMMVMSGIEKKQIAGPPMLPLLGMLPSVLLCSCCGCTKRTGENWPMGRVAACAASSARFGIWIVTGRLDVPTRSNCGARR